MALRNFHHKVDPVPKGCQIFEMRLEPVGLAYRKANATTFVNASRQWLEMEPEPLHGFDKNAIRVMGCWKGFLGVRKVLIGYVPKEVARVLVTYGFLGQVRPRLLKTYLGYDGQVQVLFQLIGIRERFSPYRQAIDREESNRTQLFLDVETTGFRPSQGDLATVVWYHDGRWGYWVNDATSCVKEMANAWLDSYELITYNGRTFDEPWLIHSLSLPPHEHHVDLMYEAAREGLKGGLKGIASKLGIPQPPELELLHGKHVLKLWKSWCKGNKESLCNLLYYNAWDVILTYRLYCHLRRIAPEPIENTMPFAGHIEALRPFLRTRVNARSASAETPVKELWCQRRINPLNQLSGALVCFTGELEHCEREEAEAIVDSLGGTVSRSVVRRLDFLVVGDTGKHGRTGKIAKAEKYINCGAHTKMITESEFLRLVDRTRGDVT
jgi:uncharacterized protein YprB with RNaseH-like and TPR domain